MKKILLRGLMLLLVAVMCFQMVACGGNEEPGTQDPGTQAPGTQDPGTQAPGTQDPGTQNPGTNPPVTQAPATLPTDVFYSVDLVKNGASDFVIVYPAGADENVTDCVTAIVNAFQTKFGVTLTAVSDTTAEVANEILVGKTNRSQSEDVMAPLHFGDSVCTVVDTKLVLVCPDSAKLSSVVGNFVAKVNEVTDNNMSFNSKNAILNVGKYDIQELKIDGVSIEEYVIVVPALDGLEHYIARILSRHIAVFSGYRLDIVTDDTEKADHEIRIGVTDRTVTTVAAGEYAVMPKDGNMEIVFADNESLGALSFTLTTNYFKRDACWLDIKLVDDGTKVLVGNQWDADAQGNGIIVGEYKYDARVTSEVSKTQVKDDANDLRIMYHDVFGHIDLEATTVVDSSVSARAALLVATYETYKPDILCLEEAGQDFPADAKILFDWLEANGYKMVRDDAKGLALPIFYNSARVTLQTGKDSSGYLAREGAGTKGIAYATFKDNTNGEIFGVVNVHFSGDSDVYPDEYDSKNEAEAAKAFLAGSIARQEESNLILKAVENIRKANKTCSSVFVGGNFNHNRGKYAVEVDEDGLETGNLIDPLAVLTDDGLIEVRDKEELDAEKNSQYAPYDSSSKLVYNKDYNYVSFVSANKRPAEEEVDKNGKIKYPGSADFIFYDGKPADFDAKMYEVVTDIVAATSSDHLPHFVDIAWK